MPIQRSLASMDIFRTHSQVIQDYESYIKSFLNIADASIRTEVERALEGGKLWPAPLIQFNPSFEVIGDIADLTKTNLLHPAFADIFRDAKSGQLFKLYRHQIDALKLGTAGKGFVVTSGTGSGKSLTYIGTIFDHLLREPAAKGVTAVIVYPMNALINSQYAEFERYKANFEASTGKDFPITFGQYTGQEKEDRREAMRENPPQILLTNYMMLELLLTRVRERPIRDAIYANLRFLVFDELHTYRGRQGADVAMLIRRIQSQSTHNLVCIGTSATMVSGGTLEGQQTQVAAVATKLFGRPFTAGQVINELLTRSLDFSGAIPVRDALAQAIATPIDPAAPVAKLKAGRRTRRLGRRRRKRSLALLGQSCDMVEEIARSLDDNAIAKSVSQFIKERNNAIHAARIPMAEDYAGIKIAIISHNDNEPGYRNRIPWDSVHGDNFQYLEQWIEDTSRDFLAVLKNPVYPMINKAASKRFGGREVRPPSLQFTSYPSDISAESSSLNSFRTESSPKPITTLNIGISGKK